MVARVTLLMLALLFFLQGIGQHKDYTIAVNHPDRYCLELPEGWDKPKLVEAITDILPKAIDVLKDREFCTEGKAAYYVRLFIDSLSVDHVQTTTPVETGSASQYNFSFNYSFYAALMILDSLQKPISLLQLISSDETMTYSKQFSLRPQNQNVVYKYQTFYDARGRPIRRVPDEPAPVNYFVPTISPFSLLTKDFLYSLCQKKIFQIRKLLKKIIPD